MKICAFTASLFTLSLAPGLVFAAAQQISMGVGRATPVVDGVVNEGEYPACVPYMFVNKGKDPEQMPYSPRSPKTYFGWDDENLYVAMVSDGERLKASSADRDGALWDDDSIDFFFSVNHSKADVFHFIFNSRGNFYDARNGDVSWNAPGLTVRNSLRDGRWHFELALPWKSVGVVRKNWKVVRVNVARTYLSGTSEAVRSLDIGERSTVALGQGAFADRNTMAFLFFREKNSPYVFPKPVLPGKGERPKILYVSLKEPDGQLLFKAKYPVMRRQAVTFRALAVQSEKNLLQIVTDNWVDRPDEASIDIDIRDMKTDATSALKATVVAEPAHGRAAQAVDISTLAPGQWNVHYVIRDRVGEAIDSDVAYLFKPEQKPVWEDFAGGDEDEVFAPWTAPEATESGYVCWNRRYAFGDGLVCSIETAGRELLAAPVTLVLDGKPLEFDVRCVARKNTVAEYEFIARNASIPLKVLLRAEFDGFLWFRVCYGERGARVSSLTLEVPVRREHVQAFDDSVSAMNKLMLPEGGEGVWKWNPSVAPFWWLGDAKAGLMGGIENCRGWHFRDKPNGAVLTVDAVRATHRLHFVDEPFVMEGPREIGFYLEATPTKPKNMKIAAESRTKTYTWTGYVSRHFETKFPGFLLDEKCARFSKLEAQGNRVYWYNAAQGFSPVASWWSWYGRDWSREGDPASYCLEIPQKDKQLREHHIWAWACLMCKSFYDLKNWSLSWFLNDSGVNVKNLYFDLSMPVQCRNASHGCAWADEFGYTHYSWNILKLREFYKRVKRQLLKANPDASMLGHLQFQRTPADVFFDALTMGEIYEREFRKGKYNYYDVLKPEDMQITYAFRANESVIDIEPQIKRCLQIFAPERLKTYDPNAPESKKEIRHAVAYIRIHDLLVTTRPDSGAIWEWWGHDQFMEKLGTNRVHKAYYHADCPIRVDKPHPRFIYSYDISPVGSATIFLNDTDETLTREIVSPEFTGTLTLGPREARFIERLSDDSNKQGGAK